MILSVDSLTGEWNVGLPVSTGKIQVGRGQSAASFGVLYEFRENAIH